MFCFLCFVSFLWLNISSCFWIFRIQIWFCFSVLSLHASNLRVCACLANFVTCQEYYQWTIHVGCTRQACKVVLTFAHFSLKSLLYPCVSKILTKIVLRSQGPKTMFNAIIQVQEQSKISVSTTILCNVYESCQITVIVSSLWDAMSRARCRQQVLCRGVTIFEYTSMLY